MRHKQSGRRLSRDMGHRNALRKNLVSDLFTHEQIITTEDKARTIRPLAERIITKAKRGLAKGQNDPAAEVHARRLVASRIMRWKAAEDEDGDVVEVDVVKKLFNEIAPRYATRPGGCLLYTSPSPRD